MGKYRNSLVGVAVSVAFAGVADVAYGDCQNDTLLIAGRFGEAQFSVSVADTSPKREQGLMHVKNLPRFDGMLFVYDAPQTTAFWMRNTLIPLDMLFADKKGVIVKIHENAIPLDETPIFGGKAIQFVLEINGGMVGTLGIETGSQMYHMSIDAESLDHCL